MAEAAAAAAATEASSEATEAEQAAARGDNFDPDAGAGEGTTSAEGAGEGTGDGAGGTGDGGAEKGGSTGEGEGTGDGTRDKGTGDGEAAAKPGHTIPQVRYNAMRDRYKSQIEELQNQIAVGQQQPQQPQQAAQPQETLDGMLESIDNDMMKAIADGDTEKAVRFQQQARTLERRAFAAALDQASTRTQDSSSQGVTYDLFVEQVESIRPELNIDSDSFDEAISNEVVMLTEDFQGREGVKPKQALEKALDYVFQGGWRDTGKQEQAEQRRTDVNKNLETANAQAPGMTSGNNSDTAGKTSTVSDIMKLSDAEFEKLTDAELGVMRGDNF